MEVSENNPRLLILFTHSFPKEINMDWVSKLPFLGSHARQGLWTSIRKPLGATEDKIWSLFTTGSNSPEVVAPFWKFIENSGKKIILFAEPEVKDPSITLTIGDLDEILPQEDWNLCITFHNQNVEVNETSTGSQLQRFDRQVESLVLAAGPKTMFMVISSPDSENNGWIISGGYQVAPIGNPGQIDLLDLPPTVLWLMGCDVPPYMNGQIMDDLIQVDSQLTQDEMDLLTDHLRGLGYLG